MPYLLFGTVYVVVYLVTAALLTPWPEVRVVVADGLLFALALAVCGVILWRRRSWEGTQRLFWDAFGVSMLLWLVGGVGFMFNELRQGQASWVQWHTMFSLAGGIGPMIAVLARPHRGVRKEATAAVAVDLAGWALLAGFIYAYFIMVPSVVPTTRQALEGVLLRLVQGHRLLLVVGFGMAAWVARATSWRDTYVRLLAGCTAGFVLRMLANRAIAQGTYRDGSVYDLAWILPFIVYAWAAAEAPASPAAGDRAIELPVDAPPALLSAVPVLLIPVLGYGLLRMAPVAEPAYSFRVLLTTMSTVAGLGLLTLRLSVQSTELQRADARLKLLAAAIEQTADLILITRADASIEHANDACVRALGYPREALARKTLPELLEHGFERMVDHIGRTVRKDGIWRGTLVHRRADGSTFPAATTVVALRDHDGVVTHFVGVQRDIAEELKLRDQLVHSERLSAVGELVAGVAHEINNPLQTIIGSVELLLEEGKDPQQRQDLKVVRQEATRAGQIVRNLLAFVRRNQPDREPADLNALALATAELREYHLVQSNIALVKDLQPGSLPVLANREEIQQVILNLLLNAEQAILGPSGSGTGTITMRTYSEGTSYVFQLSDDGPGIPQELRGRVFEPFFTTKEVGHGTGLGLSIALGIASSHGGGLELCHPSTGSGQGHGGGACFKLTLPAHAASSLVQPPVEARPPKAAAARGAALVVEDEAPVRSLLVRLLDRRGYAVVEATTTAEAKRAIDERSYAVVLCDLRLTDGNGLECVRHLRALRPELANRVVFVTGDAGALGKFAPEFAEVPVLPKPFTIADLDRVLAGLAVTA